MPTRLPTAPDPAALAALQAETARTLRTALDELKARAVALGPDAAAQAIADALREAGALRDRIQHDLRMGRIGRGPARALQREVDDIGRGAQEHRRERGRRREAEREVRAAHTMALPALVAEFVAAVDAYDPFEKGRARADAVQAARQRVQELLEAGAEGGRAREAMHLWDTARRALAAKYKQREASAKDNEAEVDGLILGFRAALDGVDTDAPKELLAVASAARRKVADALRDRLLPREIRARLLALFEPLDGRHRAILEARHQAYLQRKERREQYERERRAWEEQRERERREREAERLRELITAEAKLLHYTAVYCSMVYAFDPAGAPKGAAALVRLARRPIDFLLRDRVGRPSRVKRIVEAVRSAALEFEDRLEARRKIFVGERDDAPREQPPELPHDPAPGPAPAPASAAAAAPLPASAAADATPSPEDDR